jgi:hypothetical protein
MCFSTGLPIEEEPEGSDKVLAALAAAMDAHDGRVAGVSAGAGMGGGAGGGRGRRGAARGPAAAGGATPLPRRRNSSCGAGRCAYVHPLPPCRAVGRRRRGGRAAVCRHPRSPPPAQAAVPGGVAAAAAHQAGGRPGLVHPQGAAWVFIWAECRSLSRHPATGCPPSHAPPRRSCAGPGRRPQVPGARSERARRGAGERSPRSGAAE